MSSIIDKTFIKKFLLWMRTASFILLFGWVQLSWAYVKPDAFMELGFDAISMGLGEANITSFPRPDAIYRNPALLGQIHTLVVSANVVKPYARFFDPTQQISGINYFSLALAQRTGKLVTMGYAMNYLGVSEIPRTDQTGDTIQGYFNSYMVGMLLGASRKLSSNLDLGVAAKFMFEKLDDAMLSFKYPALNVGLIYFLDNNLRCGLKVENAIPTKLKDFTLLPTATAGISYRSQFFEFFPAFTLGKDYQIFRFGVLTYFDPLNFAVGYTLDMKQSENNRISAGFNINLNSVELGYSIAFLNLDKYLSPTHYVSLILWY